MNNRLAANIIHLGLAVNLHPVRGNEPGSLSTATAPRTPWSNVCAFWGSLCDQRQRSFEGCLQTLSHLLLTCGFSGNM